jgi:hypothetical protein
MLGETRIKGGLTIARSLTAESWVVIGKIGFGLKLLSKGSYKAGR